MFDDGDLPDDHLEEKENLAAVRRARATRAKAQLKHAPPSVYRRVNLLNRSNPHRHGFLGVATLSDPNQVLGHASHWMRAEPLHHHDGPRHGGGSSGGRRRPPEGHTHRGHHARAPGYDERGYDHNREQQMATLERGCVGSLRPPLVA